MALRAAPNAPLSRAGCLHDLFLFQPSSWRSMCHGIVISTPGIRDLCRRLGLLVSSSAILVRPPSSTLRRRPSHPWGLARGKGAPGPLCVDAGLPDLPISAPPPLQGLVNHADHPRLCLGYPVRRIHRFGRRDPPLWLKGRIPPKGQHERPNGSTAAAIPGGGDIPGLAGGRNFHIVRKSLFKLVHDGPPAEWNAGGRSEMRAHPSLASLLQRETDGREDIN